MNISGIYVHLNPNRCPLLFQPLSNSGWMTDLVIWTSVIVTIETNF